jgi:integrase
MARPSKTAPIDYAKAHDLTHGLLERATCPSDKAFVLIKDADKKGLRLRVTKAGGKHWQFEARVNGKLFSRALGEWPAVSISDAKEEAHRLRGLTEKRIDPREIERTAQEEAETLRRQEEAAQEAKRLREKAESVTVGEVWSQYLAERKPMWGELHYKDHERLARAGGVKAKRGTAGRGVTIDMPLYPLMALRLADLTAPKVEAWAAAEAKTRPTSARLAWRLLKVFLNWCAEQPEFASILPASNAAATRKSREALGRSKPKTDALLREQLPAWFSAVRGLPNQTIAAYLQIMLLTGARPTEVLELRWEDVNTQWRGITIRDKVEGDRLIPLTPYASHLMAGLPRRNEWVFASTRTVSMDSKNVQRRQRRANDNGAPLSVASIIQTSASGHITEPREQHARACQVANVEHLTLHGLRRSFKSLSEWVEVPVGVVAQIMGHKPSATAEKHYTVRPLDLLRLHHERIEAWILEQAGVTFEEQATTAKLRVAKDSGKRKRAAI